MSEILAVILLEISECGQDSMALISYWNKAVYPRNHEQGKIVGSLVMTSSMSRIGPLVAVAIFYSS